MTNKSTYGEDVSVTAENQFSDPLYVRPQELGTVTITGTFVGTITLQFRLGNTSDWVDRDSKTSGGRWYFQGGGDEWRIGCKTGDYTSGTAVCRIQGR